jgi:hypothetical protein
MVSGDESRLEMITRWSRSRPKKKARSASSKGCRPT